MAYKVYELSFTDWKDYQAKVNQLYNSGWLVDETLEKLSFRDLGKKHILRLKRIKNKPD